MTLRNLIFETRHNQQLSGEAFADALTEKLPGESLTRAAISAWELGISKPRYLLMLAVMMTYGDWRYDFAHEVLKQLRPDLFDEPAISAG